MKHKMKLQNDPYKKIKNKTKTIELRLNDEKRQKIKINDTIELTNIETQEKLVVQVIDLFKYSSFKELYKNCNKIEMGYKENEKASFKDMEKYYSKEEQAKYGVVGIKIKLLDGQENIQKQENYISECIPLGMCFGLCFGSILGSIFGNISLGMCYGISIGMLIGTLVGSGIKKDK